MKKAKLILAGIACLAIVGGVFASKARTSERLFTRSNTTTVCTVPLAGVTFATTLTTLPISTTFITNIPGACPVALPYYPGL